MKTTLTTTTEEKTTHCSCEYSQRMRRRFWHQVSPANRVEVDPAKLTKVFTKGAAGQTNRESVGLVKKMLEVGRGGRGPGLPTWKSQDLLVVKCSEHVTETKFRADGAAV